MSVMSPVQPQSGSDSSSPQESAEVAVANFDLREYVRVILKRKWVIAAVIALAVTGTVLYTMRLPKIYEATATIVIDPKPMTEVLGNEVQEVVQLGAGQMWWNQEYYNTQVDILKSQTLARLTVTENKLQNNPKLVGDVTGDEKVRIDRATGVLLGALGVKQNDQNRIFHIRVRHGDPELAAFLANAHVATYIQYNLNLRREGTDLASKWLSDELDSAEQSLKQSSSELFSFRQDNQILAPSIEDEQKRIANNIDKYTELYNEAHARRMDLESMRRQLGKIASNEVLESPVFELTESETGELLKRQFYEERNKLKEMETQLGDKNEELAAQRDKVNDIYESLKREATIATQAVEQKYQKATADEQAYKSELATFRKQESLLSPTADKYKQLTRKEKNDEDRFNIVIGRLSSSDLSSRLNTVNIRRLDDAQVPGAPAFPRMDRNVAIAGLLSVVLGVLFAFFLEYIDRTVKTTQDVEEAVGAPLLGIIPIVPPEIRQAKQPSRDLHVFEEPSSRAAECCRHIRTNLLFMSADRQFETLVVASPNPREGKSTTVMYMGTTIARGGQRVLVIDSDMRRPRLHQSIGVSRAQGLSNLIVGEVSPDDVIKSTGIPNMYFLPCGPTPPNPAELLMTDRFKEVMKELRGRFDRILLDSPPILAVTDALVLARHADGVALVMKAGSTTRDDARRCAKQLYAVKARIAGVILNELDIEDRSYGYYYQYYAYGYGKTEAEGREPTPAA